MSDLKVGIIGAENERHCLYLAQALEAQGVHPIILDNSPDKPFPLSFYDQQCQYEDLDLSHIHVYFLRALFLPTPAFEISKDISHEGYVAYVAERERYASWLSWLMSGKYHDRHIVNPVETLILHFAKPYHLQRLKASGIPVPKTLVTSDADQLLEFSRHRDVVYKPVAGGALCQLLKEEDKKPERLKRLATAPVQFQEYIEGEDLRVFVLDGKVIAAFIIEGEDIDYRKDTVRVIPFEITPTIESLCIRACDALGLIFSGVDLKLKPDGTVVCIECNPSPMFEGFDRVAPQSIVSQLASYLIEKSYQLQKIHQV